MRTSQEIEETCKKLKPLIGSEADKLWYFYLTEDEQDRRVYCSPKFGPGIKIVWRGSSEDIGGQTEVTA